MHDWIQVSSQAEVDAALAAGRNFIELTQAITVELRVPAGVVAVVKAVAGAWFRAWGSSHVVAWESSHVEAWGSSHVVAWGAASLTLFGELLKATATTQVVVQLHQQAQCKGGVQVTITAPKTAQEWCDYYGVAVDGEHAILFKALDENFHSSRNTFYKPGTETIAADWDGGSQECGLGLHFSPHPAMGREFNSTAKKFVACLVPLSEIAVHPDGIYPHKVKAGACWNHYECDSMGTVFGEKFAIKKMELT